jgi:5-methylcytosine-specific restriction endonuclease McrA
MSEVKKRRPSFGNTLRSTKDNCFFCNRQLDDYSRTVDHLLPQKDGGIRSNDNKVYACRSCNQLKGDMHMETFVESLESMIRFETTSHKKSVGYLKKVKRKVELAIKNKKGNAKKTSR